MDINKEHHPFCNYWMNKREGCPSCEKLYRRFPINENETIEEAIDRILKKDFPGLTIKNFKK